MDQECSELLRVRFSAVDGFSLNLDQRDGFLRDRLLGEVLGGGIQIVDESRHF
jgi:hypothetical protein